MTVAVTLPGDEQHARNLIGGSWEFAAAPFDYEIRSPLDGTVTTVVPLSSRFDVARAVTAARSAAASWAAAHSARRELLTRLAAEIGRCAEPLATLQALETGLEPADSRAAVAALSRYCGILLNAEPPGMPAAGASGHILSWGLPFAEVVCAVLPQLHAGHTAVIKPSLRAPMSAAAFAQLATSLGFPPGVVNLVQGTGVDAGAALASAVGLATLHVRAGARTLGQAARAAAVTGTPLTCLRAGGNIALAGPDADLARVADAVASALRTHSAGGPLSLPLLCVHSSAADALVDAILARLETCRPAPLPSEPLRDRALARVAALLARGATLLRGGLVPDDARHRMGWVLPPTVIMAGAIHGEAALAATGQGGLADPVGPVLTVVTWRSPAELAGMFRQPRHADGVACAWGLSDAELAAAALPHTVLPRETTPVTALADGTLPAAWTGGGT
jgi:acyl-CoA reductase-like NAD-dependent aldehyde dehydrogenase